MAFTALVVALVALPGCRREEPAAAASAAAEAPTAAAAASPAGEPQAPPQELSVVEHTSPTLGALEVKSVAASPVDWYEVLREGESAIAGSPPLLGTTVDLPPGTYVVDVNRTQREVTVEAGRKTVLWTGELAVEGEPTSAFWYPMQGEQRRLSSNPPLLGRGRALFAGTYEVFVYVSVTTGDQRLGEGVVRPGERTVLTFGGGSQ